MHKFGPLTASPLTAQVVARDLNFLNIRAHKSVLPDNIRVEEVDQRAPGGPESCNIEHYQICQPVLGTCTNSTKGRGRTNEIELVLSSLPWVAAAGAF
jgi:hypothetical protein